MVRLSALVNVCQGSQNIQRKFRKALFTFHNESCTSSDLKQKSAHFFSEADDKIRIGLDCTELD